MSQQMIEYYLGLTTEPWRTLQQQGKKIFSDQSNDELVITVCRNNWSAFLRRYGMAQSGWIVFILLTLTVWGSGANATVVLSTAIITLMLAILVDACVMLGIINRLIDGLILTSKRLIWLRYRNLFANRSDIINFDVLNECISSSDGIFTSKVARTGKLVLKLASGESRTLNHIPSAGKVADLISRVSELHRSHGSQLSFASLFTAKEQPHEKTFRESMAATEDIYKRTILRVI